jgi:hypothetical protein
MARIPLIGVPKRVGTTIRSVFSGRLGTVLYRLALITVGGAILYAMAVSSVFIATFVAGIVLSAFLADDISAAAMDLWNRNWAELKLNLFG